jgi:alkyl hydroperoxide reductase subunit AhpF
MHLLEDRDAEAVRRHLAPLTGAVRLLYFTEGGSGLIVPGHECRSCGDTQRLLEDVARCSDRLTLEVHDRFTDPEAFQAYGIVRIPGLAVIGAQDYGIRFYGMPAGYELRTLLEMIVDVDRGAADLSAETRTALAALAEDVHLQVLVTPT